MPSDEPSPRPPRLDIGVYGARAIPSTYSGYETFLTTLLPRLVDRGHDVTMYCRTGEVDDDTPFLGVRRSVLPAIGTKQMSTLSHGIVAASVSRARRHDVVLVVNVANAPYCLLHRVTGQPVVLNVDGQEWLRGKWGPAARRYFKTSARISRWTSNALVSDCEAMAEVYRREFGARSTVIPYCPPDRAEATQVDVLEQYGVAPDGYFVTGGRLNPENNIDRIAAAYAASDLPLPLLVLGAANYDSPVQRELEALARRDERIRFVGHVEDRSHFLSLIGHAAAYIHGHSVGGMNPSLVEAMSAGSVIAALDTPFNRETVGPSAHLFASPGPELLDVLRRLGAMTADVRARLRTAVRDEVEERLSAAQVTDAYESLLAAAAAAGARNAVTIPTRWSP